MKLLPTIPATPAILRSYFKSLVRPRTANRLNKYPVLRELTLYKTGNKAVRKDALKIIIATTRLTYGRYLAPRRNGAAYNRARPSTGSPEPSAAQGVL